MQPVYYGRKISLLLADITMYIWTKLQAWKNCVSPFPLFPEGNTLQEPSAVTFADGCSVCRACEVVDCLYRLLAFPIR